MEPIVECIPNFSEGVNQETLNAIERAVSSIDGVYFLDRDESAAANRTVMTFAGAPEPVCSAAFEAVQVASQLIDMRTQRGVHPRIGATDVCPIVPLQGISAAELVPYVEALGARIGKELQVPVYMYEYNAKAAHRKTLPQIRKGEYEGLKMKMQLPDWKPDYGDTQFDARRGATVLGVRDVLVAFNISLATDDASLAGAIAARLRASSKSKDALPKLRAIGWFTEDFGQGQVSCNLIDFRETSPLKVWLAVNAMAAEYGAKVVGSELVGLIPERCVREAGVYANALNKTNVDDIAAGVDFLKLNAVKPFHPELKILEQRFELVSGKKINRL